MNKKSQQRVQQHNVVKTNTSQVEVVSSDELAVFSEDDLRGRVDFLMDELRSRHLVPMSREAAPWESELAYAQREFEIRDARKLRHRKYMDTLRAEEVDENSLPEYQGNPPPTWLF